MPPQVRLEDNYEEQTEIIGLENERQKARQNNDQERIRDLTNELHDTTRAWIEKLSNQRDPKDPEATTILEQRIAWLRERPWGRPN